jgi:hypothetical protein
VKLAAGRADLGAATDLSARRDAPLRSILDYRREAIWGNEKQERCRSKVVMYTGQGAGYMEEK